MKNKEQYLRLFIITFGLSMLFITSCSKNQPITNDSIVGKWKVYQQRTVTNTGAIVFKDRDYTTTYNADHSWTESNGNINPELVWSVNGSEFSRHGSVCVLTWTIPNKEWNYSYHDGDVTLYLKK
jgi:hypothetical protein